MVMNAANVLTTSILSWLRGAMVQGGGSCEGEGGLLLLYGADRSSPVGWAHFEKVMLTSLIQKQV